jgi:hypothetical protein
MNKCFAFCGNSNKNNEVISSHFLKPKTLTQDVTQPQTFKERTVLTPDNQVEPVQAVLPPLKGTLAFPSEQLTVPFELEQVPVSVPVPVPVPVSVPVSVPEHFIEDIYPGIDGYGFVLMANQEYKQIYNLKKGDVVMSFDPNNIMIASKIKYIVKTKINNFIMMSYMNNIAMSSNHKIQLNNSDWFYPKHYLSTYNSKIDYLYNIVLENGCGIIVNNLKVITLGYLNTFDRDKSYYATQAFVDDMSKYDINNDGYIVFENNN